MQLQTKDNKKPCRLEKQTMINDKEIITQKDKQDKEYIKRIKQYIKEYEK